MLLYSYFLYSSRFGRNWKSRIKNMKNIGKMGIHYLQRLNAANIPKDLIEKGQNRVIEASLTLIRERAKLKV